VPELGPVLALALEPVQEQALLERGQEKRSATPR